MKTTSKLKSELDSLAKVLSGEAKLEKDREQLVERKQMAVERQKSKLRAQVIARERKLQNDPVQEELEQLEVPVEPKKIVQNIKLFQWKAPIRLKFPFDRKAFMFIVVGSLFFILYLALLGQYGLMFALIALIFFIYVAGTFEPITVTHKITARGIETLDKLYEWHMLDEFFFSIKNEQHILVINTKLRIPSRLILLLDPKDRSAIFVLLEDKLLYKDIKKQNWLEKATFGDYIPLERV